MKSKKFMALLMGVVVSTASFTGCMESKGAPSQDSTTIVDTADVIETQLTHTTEINIDTSTMFSNGDKDTTYDESASTVITLGSQEVVTISKEGTYIIGGTLSNGQIVVDAAKADKIHIVLDSVNITSQTSAPIYVKQADKVFITLAEGTQNTLINGGEFVAIDENSIDGVIFSKDDLTINGTGTLNIETTAGDGIVSKDDLVVAGGTYNITSSGHGLSGKDSIRIAEGALNLKTGKDGLHSSNTEDTTKGFIYIENGKFNMTAEGDGLDASGWIYLRDGNIQVITGGSSQNAVIQKNESMGGRPPLDKFQGKDMPTMPEGMMPTRPNEADGSMPTRPNKIDGSMPTAPNATEEITDTSTTPSTKGIKAGGDILINKGNYVIDALDDAIHSNSNLCIVDGSFQLAAGDDGIHADGNVTIQGGTINITKSYEGIEGESVDIKDGDMIVVASDDGINAGSGDGANNRPGMSNESNYIRIEGGVIKVDAGSDGIDSNGNVYMTGGEVCVEATSSGPDSGLDYDGIAEISGGTFVAFGVSTMAQNFGDTSTQGSILVTSQSMQQGEMILKDASHNTLLSYTPSEPYNAVVISIADIKKDEKYTITMGTDTQTVEMTSSIYGSGNPMGGGDRGDKGMGGRRPANMSEPPNK